MNARESTKDKIKEVEHIIGALGEWQGVDGATGFQLVKIPDGRVLRIADLVDDDLARRDRVTAALKDSAQKNNRDWVDIIIALGMAKEGFDWIWCEHALTIGYRASLTEVVQIIGRATRDASGKTRARFTNLIAEPDAAEDVVTEAVNDTLKAIAAKESVGRILDEREFADVFRRISLEQSDFTPERYKPGNTGEAALYRELKELSGITVSKTG